MTQTTPSPDEANYPYSVAKRVCRDLGLQPGEDAYRGQILSGWLGVSWVDYIERTARAEINRRKERS